MNARDNISENAPAQKRILLMGNPNVGKSVFFTELTGVDAVSSNFVGTTVTYMEGAFKTNAAYTLVDVPGTYSLSPTSEAEAVATTILKAGAEAVICVLDASNLERNLCLALELQHCDIPKIYALNMTDVAERKGILVNEKLLSQELGAPVIPTVAVKRKGFDEITTQLEKILNANTDDAAHHCHCETCPSSHKCGEGAAIWSSAKSISRKITKNAAHKKSRLDKLGDAMMKPFPGLPIAFGVLLLTIGVVSFGGRALRIPFRMLVDGAVVPFFRNLFENFFAYFMNDGGHLCYSFVENSQRVTQTIIGADAAADCAWPCILLNILVGEYGIFVISFQWIIALILPYVFMFYLAISFLEDSGYLPRICIMFDNVMRKLGVQGGSLIHVFLALGCAVPAIMGSRTATTRKERLMIAAIVCFAVPCVPQLGALISLMSAYSWWMLPLMLVFAMFWLVTTALAANKILPGKVEPLLIEVPNFLMPEPKAYFRKLAIRMKHFFVDAELPMLAAVVLAALLAETGVLNVIASAAQPLMSGWLGMPKDAVVFLILGIIRREMAVAPLIELNLTHLQAFVGGVVSLLYLPCISVFGILFKEFKTKIALVIFVSSVVIAIFVGGLVNQTVRLFL